MNRTTIPQIGDIVLNVLVSSCKNDITTIIESRYDMVMGYWEYTNFNGSKIRYLRVRGGRAASLDSKIVCKLFRPFGWIIGMITD